MHHNQKVDAPSGTALMLGRAAAEGRGIDARQELGQKPRRPHRRAPGRRIGFANLRGGSVVGEHSVIFAGQAERIEIAHKAEDRMISRAARCTRRSGRAARSRALFDGRRARPKGFLAGDDVTPEQVLGGGLDVRADRRGIACLYMAYQYAIPPTGRAEPPPQSFVC